LCLEISENVKLQKETVLSLVKGSTVFINYLGQFRLLVPEYAWLIELFIKLHRMFSALLRDIFERALSLLATFLALTMSPSRDNTKASPHLM